MPYVITTRNPRIDQSVEHHAVATLEGRDYCRAHGTRPRYETRCGLCGATFAHEQGAKNIASQVVFEHTETMQPWLDQVAHLSEAGGTIGPLPDGTVIEVAHMNSVAMLDLFDDPNEIDNALCHLDGEEHERAVIDALQRRRVPRRVYNARTN